MPAAAWRPDAWFGIALNADPNDPYTWPVWNDFTSVLSSVQGYERGRNFELDQGMSSAPTLRILDPSEVLNPDNAAGPHVNLIEPYRECCMLAQWPRQADITGGAVNLFNASAWKGNKEDVRDGSFESFAVGSRPTWVTRLGGTLPAVTAGGGFSGSQRLEYTTAATTAQQGFSWPVACIPGRQYTTSIYVNQTTGSTQRISVTDQVLSSDPFNLSGTNGWGNDRLGHAWSPLRGAAAQFSYAALYATITLETTAADRIIAQDTGALDYGVYVRLIAPDPATVGTTSANSGMAVRGTDSQNYFNPMVVWRPDGTVGLTTWKRVTDVRTSVVAEVATGWTYAAGQEFILYVFTQTTGTTAGVSSMVWPVGKPQPGNFQNNATATDAILLTGTKVGPAARVEATITTPYALRFASFNVVGLVHGGTTTTTGAFTRVSVTFTATQPVHTVRLATSGTALAGTTLADAIQHEQGAAATTYITTGPLIAPMFRSSLEQYPRAYELAGFLGVVDAPSVDAMAALQAIGMQTEVAQSIDALGPDLLYRLNDGQDTLLFADTSGNGGPGLFPITGKGGPGNGLEPGTAITIAGDPGAVGLHITRNTGLDGTVIGSGPSAAGQTVVIPPYPSVPWALTVAAWVQLSTGSAGTQMVVRLAGRQLIVTLGALTTGEGMILVSPIPISSTVASAATVLDGKVHHLAGTITMDATNTTVTAYVDGVAGTPVVVATSTLGGIPSLPMNILQIGGMALDYPSGQFGASMNGTATEVAVWNRALTSTNISTLSDIGRFGFNGETSGGRILRRLTDPGRFTGLVRVTNDSDPPAPAGHQTTMQPPTWTGTKDVLSDCQETTTAEQGTFWAAPDGAVVFEDRRDRWLRLTPTYTFGENEAGGEIPYLMDQLKLIYGDPLYVFPDVHVGRVNGMSAQGGKLADIAAAARKYFPRSAGGEFDFYTDALAQSMANWIFYTHRSWMPRVETITIDPVGEPNLWPIALSLEIGQRVRFVRRAKAANAGGGITIAMDFFVEKIAYDIVFGDDGQCTWQYTIQFSPINAGASAAGKPTMQPWILGNATYGVLSQTTVLGW